MKISADYVFTPCPFCGERELIVDVTNDQMIHAGVPCEAFLETEDYDQLVDALEIFRKNGYPHGIPQITGRLVGLEPN